jgi:hypothetical protein
VFSELKETEFTHREALVELQKMGDTMDTMEQERADIITEVELRSKRRLRRWPSALTTLMRTMIHSLHRACLLPQLVIFRAPIAAYHVRDAQVMPI